MKQNYTTRLRIGAAIIAILCAVAPGMAECLSTDRVWEIQMKNSIFEKEAIRIIPDGTFDADGTSYTRLAMTEDIYFSDDAACKIYRVNDGNRDFSIYLREEDDVVYVLVPNDWTGFEPSGEEAGTEFQLFDFNAKAGDSYMSVATSGGMPFKDYRGYKTLFPVEIHVRAVDSVVIGGRKLRRQTIDRITDIQTGESVSFDAGSMPRVIETIGIVESGYPMAFVTNMPSYGFWSQVNLSRCLTREREVLWKGNSLIPEISGEHNVGTEAIVEYHALSDDSAHHLWTMAGKDAGDGTVDMTFGDFRKWRREGDNVEILEPVVSPQEEGAYKIVNNGYKTSLRVIGSDGTETDFPLYDFSKDRTEEFTSVMAEVEYEGDMPVLRSFTPIVCRIEAVEFYDWNFKFDEQEFVKWQHISEIYVPSTGETIRKNEGEEDLFSVVEGVGNINFPLVYIPGDRRPALNKVCLAGGDIVLLGENMAVPDAGHQPVRLIREGREWEYVSYHPFGANTVYRRMKFDGTEQHNGRTYHRWVTFRTTVVNHNWVGQGEDRWVDQYTVDVDHTECDVRLMREEGSRVYMLRPDGISNPSEEAGMPSTWTSSDIDRDSNEMILYDFNQRNGDVVQGCVDESVPTGFLIGNIDRTCVEDEECTVQHKDEIPWDYYFTFGKYTVYNLFDYKMVEGIGFDGWGTMTYIPIGVTTNSEPHFALNNVYDAAGNVIYPGVGETVPTGNYDGIDGIQAERLEIRVADGCIMAKGADVIQICTLDGIQVHSATPAGMDYKVSTGDWAKGTYVVKAAGASESRTVKVMIFE